jgi:hypothetical protein
MIMPAMARLLRMDRSPPRIGPGIVKLRASKQRES